MKKSVCLLSLSPILLSLWLLSCGTGGGVKNGARDKPGIALEDPPIITSATYQHSLYTGKPQPVEAAAAKSGTAPFIITYYPSLDALERDEGGTTETPSAVGDYYARIERPEGNGYAGGRPVPVEYHIQKAFVNITAEEKQRYPYDGSPKPAQASADAPVKLTVSYFPSETDRRRGTASNGQPTGGSVQAPKEPGTYYVVVSFPGDGNYRDAAKEVELSIIK
jgi:hypothetical protein